MTIIITRVIVFLFCILCASQPHYVQQKECFRTAKLGETVVMKCLTKSIWRNRVWYKLGTNRSLQLLASTGILFQQNALFDHRYSVKSSENKTTLTIPYMTMEDVGTYYCGVINTKDVLFGSGTVLELEEESRPMQTVVQSPDFIRVQSGDSVTLSCSFNTSFCSEQTSVTWLKSGLTTEIISQKTGNKNIFCGNAGGTDCVHNLTLNNVNSTKDGSYLCVVSAYGHSLTGTRIQVYGGSLSAVPDLDPTVLVLTVLNVVFSAAVVALLWVVYSYRKNQHTEGDSCPGSTDHEQAEDEITYAGVNLVPRSAPCRSASVTPQHDPVVYSEVRPQHEHNQPSNRPKCF